MILRKYNFKKTANHQKKLQIIRFCHQFGVEESRQKRILRYNSSLSTYDINFMPFACFDLLKKAPQVPLFINDPGKKPSEVAFRVFKDETSPVKKVLCYLLITIGWTHLAIGLLSMQIIIRTFSLLLYSYR